MTIIPKIIWQLSGGCTNDCWYCPSKYRNNPNYKNLDEYLSVVNKLQTYGQRQNIQEISWKFKGGEPLQFSNLNIVLRQVKSKKSYVALETSGGDSWFDLLAVIEHVDELIITHHYWQNETILNYAIDLFNEQNKKIKVFIPLLPGQIKEGRVKIQSLLEQGVNVEEQRLLGDYGQLHEKYSLRDLNIIYGRPEDWEPPPPPPLPPPPPADAPPAPPPKDPRWVDPRLSNGNPSYTGKQCWAGVDWLYIDSKGFAKGSECGGREIGNVFDSGWTPPDISFACPMLFCHHQSDRTNIRIEV